MKLESLKAQMSSSQGLQRSSSASQVETTTNKPFLKNVKLVKSVALASRQNNLASSSQSSQPPRTPFKELPINQRTTPLKGQPNRLNSGQYIQPTVDLRQQVLNGGSFLGRYLVESIDTIFMRLDTIEKEQRSVHKLVKEVSKKQRVGRVTQTPQCLPFKSIEDLTAFETVEDEVFEEVVNFLAYQGGHNVSNATAKYLRRSFDVNENILKNLTWSGAA